ncbi:hypothetical protein [Psychrobacillus sp.]|uniref:hypothetical protein n=1 Tax=Psychrobacillus sp. TaxID=1871623 RepID=UPI0028BF1C25|nr:hypothetical protein [Psychrobacillus sp.]
MYLLREWLKKREIDIPITGVNVFSSFKSIIVNPPDHTSVIYASTIPVYLRKLQRQKKYLKDVQMANIEEDIVQKHQLYMPFPMCKNWRIDTRELITGVQCEKCERFGMEKLKKWWYCPSCGNIDRLTHERAVRDWFALVNTGITNGECRKFLRIDSHQLSSRILNSMNLIRKGEL